MKTDAPPTPDLAHLEANARWLATVKALEAIAHNPSETPDRRRKARNALYQATRGSGSMGSTLGQYQGGGHERRTSGGLDQAKTEADLEGWMSNRG